VESIPFTETREYVQGIVRNEMIYRDLAASHHTAAPAAAAAAPTQAASTKGMQ
jgi:hypothetical protein